LIQPLGSRVLVRPLSEEEQTSGGIVLPDSAKKRPQEGEVLAVGPGRVLDSGEVAPMTVKKGDIVIYPEYGGTEVKVSGEDLLIIDEDSILAIKEDSPKGKKK
jgi:chaperonin GroES